MDQAKSLEIVKKIISPILKKNKLLKIDGFRTESNGRVVYPNFHIEVEINFPKSYFKDKDVIFNQILDVSEEISQIAKKVPEIQKEIDSTALYKPKSKVTESKIINKMLLLSGITKR